MSDVVNYEVQGKVALITLNRPEARNAINGDVAQGLENAINQMEEDPNVVIGILRANTSGQERPVFCAGADLKAINSGQAGSLNTALGGFGGFVYRQRKKPVIAAVDGLATAGGCELVLAADMVVATTRSAFGLAEVMRNLIAGAGGLFRLPRAIGQANAMEINKMLLNTQMTFSSNVLRSIFKNYINWGTSIPLGVEDLLSIYDPKNIFTPLDLPRKIMSWYEDANNDAGILKDQANNIKNLSELRKYYLKRVESFVKERQALTDIIKELNPVKEINTEAEGVIKSQKGAKYTPKSK